MPVIEVSNLHKRYGGTVAVDDVSFSVERGEIFGILGPNGAGKTTTVECVEGLRTPDRGTVSMPGLDPRRDRAELTQRVGVQLQRSELPDKMKVAEALALYSSFYHRPADWERLIDELGLADKRDSAFGKLSGPYSRVDAELAKPLPQVFSRVGINHDLQGPLQIADVSFAQSHVDGLEQCGKVVGLVWIREQVAGEENATCRSVAGGEV
jgi:ABC-type Fe3+/spermidine/putrescine transport system ATPase subunit